jgi:DNA/RNA-binding domain of Phe-tRNA-synthetase-like protein
VQFLLSPELQAVVRPGVLVVEELSVAEREPRLDAPLLAAERCVRSSPPVEGEAVRAMYRKVGLDPTRRRPSSEALLRRVARGDALPRVNVVVDVCNWCSLGLQLPYGVYDARHVSGDVVLRLGAPGEEYAGIRKDVVHVDGRLTLADTLGPFGNPSSDSARTAVTPSTTAVLVVIYAPAEVPRAGVAAALDLTARRIVEFAGGREMARFVV